MNTGLLIFGILLVVVIVMCYNNESFKISRYFSRSLPTTRSRQYTPRRNVNTSLRTMQFPQRGISQRTMQYIPRQNLRRTMQLPQRGVASSYQLPLGHAWNPQTGGWRSGTGIVPGSAISGLQQQYRNIFTPRTTGPAGTVSGQAARQQHLAPGGLGHTGWYGQGPGDPGGTGIPRRYP